jgi:hypothetical protein
MFQAGDGSALLGSIQGLQSRRAGFISSSNTGPAANICGAPAGIRV